MAFWLFVSIVIAIVALRRALRAEHELFEQRRELVELRRMVQMLADRLGERWPGAPEPEPSATTAAAAPETHPAGSEPVVSTDADAIAAPVQPPPIEVVPVDVAPIPIGVAATIADDDVTDADALENRIGGRWLLYIGIAAIVLGASYFLKFAFDNEWIGEHARVLIGLAGGIGLTMLGQRFIRRGHELYGQVLCGGGIGIVYLTIFAAHRWYEIIGSPLAFIGMTATTAVAAWLADRQRSQPLALFAVAVGFATPFLIGESDDAHVTLFSYDAILVIGTLYLARRRAWPALSLMSYVLTVMTIVLWADRAYRPNLYASVEFFLTIFVVLFLLMLRENRRSTAPAAMLATMLLALAPVLYHFGSLVNLRPRLGALFVYLILFSVAGIMAAGQLRMPWIRVLVFAGVAVPFMGLVDHGFPRSWLAAAWTTTLAVYGAHLVAQIDALDDLLNRAPAEVPVEPLAEATDATPPIAPADAAPLQSPSPSPRPLRDRMPAAEIVLLHANGLWLLFCLQALIVPRAQAWSAPVALGLAAWYGLLAILARVRHREAALHATALASAFVAIACALYFDGPSLVVALAAEGAVLVGLALRSSRLWLRLWGGALLLIAIARALSLLSDATPIAYWPLFNPRTLSCAFIVAALYVLAILHARSDRTAQTSSEPTAPTTPTALPIARHLLILAANVLTLVILSAEIISYFDRRTWVGDVERVSGAALDAELARQLSLSVVWALYAVGLIAVGIVRNYRPIRYLAMLLFAFTILKVFIVDLSTLDRAYRMLSVMALGVLLLIASYLYQRLRTTPQKPHTPQAPHTPEPPPMPQ